MKPSFSLKLKQSQQLNQQLQQSIRLLQLSSQELEREAEEWLQDNPFLERAEPDEFAEPPSAVRQLHNLGSGDDESWLNIAQEEDLKSFLHAQVCEHPLTKQEAGHVHILIDCLDERGYLAESLTEIIDHTPLEWQLDEENLRHALDLLQTFEPAGVGAENLKESLLLQLMRQPATPQRRLAAKLVQQSLGDLGKNCRQNIQRFQKMFPEADADLIQTALDTIAALNPYPASGFAASEPTAYIEPDVYIKPAAAGFIAVGNEAAWPQLAINTAFADQLQDGGASPEWREKLAEARQLLDSLKLRSNTVVRLAEYIALKQKDFFTFGEIGLVPLLLKDAAADLGLSESTVSRAVNQKYLACPRGLFALRYFFTQAVSADSGNEGFSQSALKAVISQLVQNEDRSKPLTDAAIVKLLEQQGVAIARRTVAKYRESSGIPPAHKRRLSE